MDLSDVESKLKFTFPERHRHAILNLSDPIHKACEFLVLTGSQHGDILGENEWLRSSECGDPWPDYLIAFASNGCGDFFAYDIRQNPAIIIYIDPDITVEENLRASDKLRYATFEKWYASEIEHITCPRCQSYETRFEFSKDKEILFLICMKCGFQGEDAKKANVTAKDLLLGREGNAQSLGLPTADKIAFTGERVGRAEEAAAKAELEQGFMVESKAGFKVHFGKIAEGHFTKAKEQNPNDPRIRFLPAARMAAMNPVEIWERNNRHYYIARFKGTKPGRSGFTVVAARMGEATDEVITFFPKTETQLEDFRKGKLIYRWENAVS